MADEDRALPHAWLTPRWFGVRLIYALSLFVSILGTQLPSALSPGAAYPLPLWHLPIFALAFFACLLVRIPVSNTVVLNAAPVMIAAVLLIAGVPATLLMILSGHLLLAGFSLISRMRGSGEPTVSVVLYDCANNLSLRASATVAVGGALLPFHMVPWDGSRPWPDVVQILFPLLLLVFVYIVLDALCTTFWEDSWSIRTIWHHTIDMLGAVGLWKVCLVFVGLVSAVLYTTNLFWMLGLVGLVLVLQVMYQRHLALLQAAVTASDSLRQAVALMPASDRTDDDPDREQALVHYSKLAAQRLASDREQLAYKDEVVSLLAHDLRNPLSTISGYATLLQRRAQLRQDGDRDVIDLDRVLAQIKHMVTLLDLLVVSTRGEADMFGVSMRRIDFADTVTEAVAQMRLGAADRLWRLEVKPCGPVDCDPERITQVLTNLLQNAVKYSPAGSTITVSLREIDGTAILSIHDQGIGVPLMDQQRIFDRLQRGSNVGKVAPGLGAGLYIVSRIVQAHAGQTWVESQEGQGSTFYVSLPLAGTVAPVRRVSGA